MGGAGQHTDKKKAEKQGDVKHKGKEYAEGMAEGRNTNNPVDDMVEDYLDWLGARHMLTKRREEEKAQIMSDLKSGYLHPDDIDYAMSSGQGMAEETGDKPFDNMMKKVTKTPTAKARNTERIRQKREREEETRDRLKGGFSPSPANKLSIREPKEGSSGAMANAASRLVNKDDGKVAKLRAAGDKRREDQLKSRNIAKKNEDAASVAESDPSGLMHAARHLNKEFRITAEVDGVAKRARVQAQSSRTAQEKFMKRYPTAQIHNVEDITQQMSETGVAEGGFFDPDRPNIGDVVKHKHSGAMGRVKKIGTQGGTTTVYFKDAKTGAMNYGEWKKHVFPIKKQGVAEGSFGSGYGRVFTLYVNTGEKPPTKTKTKKFKREDDAVAWAEDYADTHDQYPTLQMEIKDDNGGVVWELEESQGVAEGSFGSGFNGPFTAVVNTGERPKSRTKTKKFKREDDAILWSEDWLEAFQQYVYATIEVKDSNDNVVWQSDDEQGVAEAQLDELIGMNQGPVKRDVPQRKKPTFAELVKKSTDKRSALQRQKDGGKKNWFAEDDHEGMYSPQAIKMGNYFIKEFNLTDEMDKQLAIEIVDNCLESDLTDPAEIRKQVIKYLKQSGTIVQSRKIG
jgi:hypothetical protein